MGGIGRLTGTATTWEDLRIPGFSVKLTGSSPPDLMTNFGPSSNIDYYAFDGATTLEQVYISLQMPHAWKEGSTIYPHVHISPTSTNGSDTTPRVVRFTLEYVWASVNGTYGNSALLDMDTAAFVPNTSLWKHIMCVNGTGIAGTGQTISSILMCRLYRDPGATADTYPQDVALLSFDLHYEVDALGSEAELVK